MEGEFEFLPETLKRTLTLENYKIINEAWKRVEHPIPHPKMNGPIKIFRLEFFCENFMDIAQTEELRINKKRVSDESVEFYQSKIKSFYFFIKGSLGD